MQTTRYITVGVVSADRKGIHFPKEWIEEIENAKKIKIKKKYQARGRLLFDDDGKATSILIEFPKP